MLSARRYQTVSRHVEAQPYVFWMDNYRLAIFHQLAKLFFSHRYLFLLSFRHFHDNAAASAKNFYFKLRISKTTQIIQQQFFTLSHLSSERATGLARFVNLIGSWSPDHTYTARVRKRCPWEEEKKTTPRGPCRGRRSVLLLLLLCGKKKTRKTRHIPQLHKHLIGLSSSENRLEQQRAQGNERWTPPKNEYQNKQDLRSKLFLFSLSLPLLSPCLLRLLLNAQITVELTFLTLIVERVRNSAPGDSLTRREMMTMIMMMMSNDENENITLFCLPLRQLINFHPFVRGRFWFFVRHNTAEIEVDRSFESEARLWDAFHDQARESITRLHYTQRDTL